MLLKALMASQDLATVTKFVVVARFGMQEKAIDTDIVVTVMNDIV